MRILIADDEPMALEELRETIQEISPNTEIFCGDHYVKILHEAEERAYDIAMLDIRMPGMSGLELAKRLKEIQPKMNIIFVTAYSEYALDAHELYVSGYLLKPVNREKVEEALEHLRYPLSEAVVISDKGLVVQCFGRFEVFYQGLPVAFQREKAKEILAYLIDLRGNTTNTDELCSILWEDEASDKKKHYLRTLLRDLKEALRECGAQEALVISRNRFSIDPSKIDCDYYRFLRQEPDAVNSYQGQYMKQYSWAEMTLGWLENQKQ